MNKDIQLIFEAYCEATSFDWDSAVDISSLEVFHDSESTIAGQSNLSGHPEGPETAPIGDEDVNIYQAEFNKEEWPGLSTGDRVKWPWGTRGGDDRTDNTFVEEIKQGIVVRIDEHKGFPSVLIIREMPEQPGTMPDLKPGE